MTQKLELPNPAPKGHAHEKWTAMVDSVIEFISASRSMLQVLNDRVRISEQFREEDRKRQETEKIKLAFYKEWLNLEIKPRLESKSAYTSIPSPKKPRTLKDSGDANHISSNLKMNSAKNIEENGFNKNEKSYNVDHNNISLAPNKLYNGNLRENNIKESSTDNHLEEPAETPEVQTKETENNKIDKSINDSDIKKSKENKNSLGGISIETQSANGIQQESKEIHHFPAKPNVDQLSQTAMDIQLEDKYSDISPPFFSSTTVKCKRFTCKENKEKLASNLKDTQSYIKHNDAKTLTSKSSGVFIHQSGSALPKCQKMSKIPRTKSSNNNRNKCILLERTTTPNEGPNLEKSACNQKCHRESTYSNIHQKSIHSHK